MKSTFKSVGISIYFLFMQLFITSVILIGRMIFDYEWLDAVNDCIATYGTMSDEYLNFIFKSIMPTVAITEVIIALPILIKTRCKMYKKVKKFDILAYISLGIVLNFVVSSIVEFLPNSISESYSELMSFIIIDDPVALMITTGLVAPVVEELIFRHCICSYYKSEKVAIFVSALLFGIAHMNLVQSTYAFILGLVLATIYVKTRNLTTCTIVHLVINSTSVIYEFIPVFSIAVTITIISLIYLIIFIHKRKLVRSYENYETSIMH